VLDAVIARNPSDAEQAILVLIDGAHQDIEQVLASRHRLPRLGRPALQLKAAAPTRPEQIFPSTTTKETLR